ncbi:MAG: hypothetical protein MJ181_07440 [Treponema sp.]|nr:hypothetical protein [Treponema sp.]
MAKKDDNYFTFPNGPASNQMMNVVHHAGNLDIFQQRIGENSHSTQLDIFVPNTGSTEVSQKIVYKTDNTETTIQLDNVDLFSKSKKPLKKILTYTLVKLSQNNIVEDPANDVKISFPLQDFVDLGSYTSLATARQAFNQAKNPLTSIKIEGLVKDKKDRQAITDSGIEVLFTGAHIKKGIVEIYLNKRINWQLFALQYFSILPKSYFSLSDNAADSLLNISILARKRISEIKKNGHFTISFRTLQQILDLPDENKTKNPGRDIKDAILNALDEINKNNDEDMVIEAVYNTNGNILQFLNDGYAKVTLKNQFQEYFTELADRKNAKIEQTMKRREEIADKAKVKALAEKMKKDME